MRGSALNRRRLGLATCLALAGIAGALWCARRVDSPGPEACAGARERYAEVFDGEVGAEHAAFIGAHGPAFVQACDRFADPTFVPCVMRAADAEGLAVCERQGLRRVPSPPATEATCTAALDRIDALRELLELPSLDTQSDRTADLRTCRRAWSQAFAECQAAAPSLSFAAACEAVGRAPAY